MFEGGWDEDFIEMLQDINSKYYLPDLKTSWDEIEEKCPKYFKNIKSFFSPFIREYDKALKKDHDNALKGYVSYTLEEETECIEEQADEEYAEIFEGGEAD